MYVMVSLAMPLVVPQKLGGWSWLLLLWIIEHGPVMANLFKGRVPKPDHKIKLCISKCQPSKGVYKGSQMGSEVVCMGACAALRSQVSSSGSQVVCVASEVVSIGSQWGCVALWKAVWTLKWSIRALLTLRWSVWSVLGSQRGSVGFQVVAWFRDTNHKKKPHFIQN